MKWDKDYVKEASKEGRIIAGFNVFGHEDATAIIRAAQRANVPILLMVNRDARKRLDIEHWGALLSSLANSSSVPVGVHLDHCSDEENIRRAIKSGFTSVMFDGSKMKFEENVRLTAILSKEAHEKGVFIEGELGDVPYDDMGEVKIELTSETEACNIEKNTDLDWLAVSVGNVHRLVNKKVPIKFDVLQKIENACTLPLIIHGSSGISDEDIEKLKHTRVGKMNFGTSIRKVFGDTLRKEMEENPKEFDRQKLMVKSEIEAEETAYNILMKLK